MRGGSQLHCVVNGMAGQERSFDTASMPNGERIAVIGAGPAGLTYASLVAEQNAVTVFERDNRPGGAFRYAGKAPLFQEVVASQDLFDRHLRSSSPACTHKDVTFAMAPTLRRTLGLLAPFDRIVIATGAQYRFGLGRLRHRDCWIAAPAAGRCWSKSLSRSRLPRLVLLPWPPADRSRFPQPGRGPARKLAVIGDARSPARAGRRS